MVNGGVPARGLQSPASTAGLPAGSACVGVGPPLFCSGPRCGSVFTRSPAALKPQLFALSRLKPAEANVPVPAQLPAGVEVLPATIVFLNWAWPRFRIAPPGALMLLPAIVRLLIRESPKL